MSMHKKHKRKKRSGGKIDEVAMTPMIDVVFQLLVYFVVTFEPIDVFAHLQVYRPSPDPKAQKTDIPPKMIRIAVYPDGFTINDKPVSVDQMTDLMFTLADIDKNQTIMISCTAGSKHKQLVKVLDLCAMAELNNLSVVSTN